LVGILVRNFGKDAQDSCNANVKDDEKSDDANHKQNDENEEENA